MRRFGIYIHWPFCQAKCPYCDFNSHVSDRIDHERWRHAYLQELDRYAAMVPDGVVGSIFFGGGTPSLMDAATVTAVIDRIQANWRTTNDLEVTLEANPTSVEAKRFRAYRQAGVNRVSLGIQALSDIDLRRLGRRHSAAEAITAYGIAKSHFDRVSFDLIYARQDQSLEDWQDELAEALALEPDHLSLYQLTIEPGTAFGRRAAAGGLPGLPGEDLGADLFGATQELTTAAGLPAYEISNHAVPGAESRHNLLYWTGGDYIGIGPGAHGRLTLDGARVATEAISTPARWLQFIGGDAPPDRQITLSRRESFEERLLMGLRTDFGVAVGSNDVSRDKVEELERLDLLRSDNKRLSLTTKGRPLLDAVVRELLS